MSRVDDLMTDDGPDETESEQPTQKERVHSLMESEYESTDKSKEPDDNKLVSDHPIAKSNKKEEKVKKEEKPSEDKKETDEENKDDKPKEEDKKDQKRLIKYKVDGKEVEEEVSDQDLINSYSGQKAIQKRFLDIDKEKKTLAKDREVYTKDYEFIKNEMTDVRNSFKSVIEEFSTRGKLSKDPVEGIYNLLDKMGLDTKEYDKALFAHFIPSVSEFLDMDDVGREAFILKKENGWLQRERDKMKESHSRESEHRSKLEAENSVKRQSGISENQFNELRDELENKFNLPNLSTEQVIQWSKEKPFYVRAEGIAEKVPGTDIVKVAKILHEFPDTTDEWMLDQLGYKKLVEKNAMEDLKDKIPPKPLAKKKSYDDDDEDELFKNFRRR